METETQTNFTMIGRRVGMLVVEAEVDPVIISNGKKRRKFKCVCDCGNRITASYNALLCGERNNCGCTPHYPPCHINLSGYRFGKLLVISEADPGYDSYGRKNRRWRCICDCGNTAIIRQCSLTSQNHTRSCGCLLRSFRDPKKTLIGNRYGLLTVISSSDPKILKNGDKTYTWLCQCDCGSKTVVYEQNLLKGHTKSCGCLVGTNKKHKSIDLIGCKFGMLTAKASIEPYKDKRGKNRYLYICLCDCGQEHVAEESNLKTGRTISCGCLNYRNLINKRVGHLIILSRNKTKPSKLLYDCQCDFGKVLVASFNDLYNSIVTDCGCQGEKYTPDNGVGDKDTQDNSVRDNTGLSTDLTGQVFGLLTAVQKAPPLISPDRRKSHAWSCRCECGNQIAVRQERLTGKGARSCGCIGLFF